MELDRRTTVELTIAALAIVVFTAGAYVVSGMYAVPGAGEGAVPPSVRPAGGLALVGVIGAFVLVVAAAGLVVYSLDLDD